MQFRSLATLSLGIALLAACTQQEGETAPAPEPLAVETPLEEEIATVELPPLAEGHWEIGRASGLISASFGPAADQSRLTFTCDRIAKSLTMTIAGSADGTETYVVETGEDAASLDMSRVEGMMAMSAEIIANAAVFSGFMTDGAEARITAPNGSMMRVPGSSQVLEVFQACS